MRFADFMEQQGIKQRVRQSVAMAQARHEREHGVEVLPLDAVHFPNLEPEARERLAARGIDAEESYKAFMLHVLYGDLGLEMARGMMAVLEVDAA